MCPVPGHVINNSDCDDTDPSINPDTTWHMDADSDGFGSDTDTIQNCSPPPLYFNRRRL